MPKLKPGAAFSVIGPGVVPGGRKLLSDTVGMRVGSDGRPIGCFLAATKSPVMIGGGNSYSFDILYALYDCKVSKCIPK